MRWYINDSSLQGQFETKEAFVSSLGKVASVRFRLSEKQPRLFCARQIWQRPATIRLNVHEAVQKSRSDEKRLILSWITNSGPFIEDERQEEQEGYFRFGEEDVTGSGLGEAARRERAGDSSGVFSFVGGPIDFEKTPLTVSHVLPENEETVSVSNIWDVLKLESRLRESRAARDWAELIAICRERFDRLEISGDIPEIALNRETFCRTVAESIQLRLDVLQRVMSGRSVSDGKMTDDARELWQKHSQGDRAWFSDESERNKQRFAKELTFRDPSNTSASLPPCYWHGKINQRTFRIHFQWPVPPGQARLKVLYIGPKITRR